MELVMRVYRLSAEWPRSEIYGLTAQVRRAAVSIPTNIAEGVGRGSSAEAVRFCRIATGSLYELDTLLQVAADLEFATSSAVGEIRDQMVQGLRGLSGFINYQRGRPVEP